MSGQTATWLTAAGLAFAILFALGARFYLRKRPTSEELEARRRMQLNQRGRIIAGQVTDLPRENLIVYEYDVRGVYYTSAQEVASLTSQLPGNPWQMLGPVSVKYDPHNPANSIILCENWSGISRKKEQSS